MKIVITTSNDQDLEAKVDLRFGRAPYFAIIITETMEIEFMVNSASTAASGAGVLAAQLVIDQNVDAVISGNFGPKAFKGLVTAKLKLFSVNGGTINEAVEVFKDGKLKEIPGPTNEAHSGIR